MILIVGRPVYLKVNIFHLRIHLYFYQTSLFLPILIFLILVNFTNGNLNMSLSCLKYSVTPSALGLQDYACAPDPFPKHTWLSKVLHNLVYVCHLTSHHSTIKVFYDGQQVSSGSPQTHTSCSSCMAFCCSHRHICPHFSLPLAPTQSTFWNR